MFLLGRIAFRLGILAAAVTGVIDYFQQDELAEAVEELRRVLEEHAGALAEHAGEAQ